MENVDPILNPSVFFGAFELREPITTLTDFMVGITCWIAVWYFQRNKSKASETFQYYQIYFLCFAIGMTSAAWLGHGFQAYISPKWKMIGWLCGVSGQLFLGFASLKEIQKFISSTQFSGIKWLLFAQYIVFISLILIPATSSFKVPQVGSALALVAFTLPIQAFNYYKTKNIGSLLIVSGIVYGLAPGYVYNNQISVSKWFNYHDISHVLVCMFMIMMIFGTRKLAFQKDSEPLISK